MKSCLLKGSYSTVPSFHLILSCTFPRSQGNTDVYPVQFFSRMFAMVDSVLAFRDDNYKKYDSDYNFQNPPQKIVQLPLHVKASSKCGFG
jgi:hypothetical protein